MSVAFKNHIYPLEKIVKIRYNEFMPQTEDQDIVIFSHGDIQIGC